MRLSIPTATEGPARGLLVRTPICKARRGAFRDTPPDDLLAAALRGALARAQVPPADIGEIAVGNVLLPNAAFVARIGQFLAGIPETVPVMAVNRQCSSGLQAVVAAADAIRDGRARFAVGAGVESMSQKGMADSITDLNPRCARASCSPAVRSYYNKQIVAQHHGA